MIVRLRHIITFLGFGLLSMISWAQERSCGFDTQKDDPRFELIERNTQAWLSDGDHHLYSRSNYTLPVVFHVVYERAEDNISELQITSQLAILNRDFGGDSENRGRIPAVFQALETSPQIRFCLATIDPDGNPTSGITRTATTIPGIGALTVSQGRNAVHYDAWGGKDAWDPTRYINVWVADLNGLLGKATFPGMATFAEEDGIIIDPSAIGALGIAEQNAPFDRGHTLTHEMGHYLNLLHLWGNDTGCADDDLVDDTPDQAGPYAGCPPHPQESCGSADMFMNFMALTDDSCLAMFTKGQVDRMVAALEVHRPGLAGGKSLCQPVAPGRTPIDSITVFYSRNDHKIILTSGLEYEQAIDITISSLDGRMLTARTWLFGTTFWIEAGDWPSGIYIVTIRNGENRRSRLLAVYR